MKIKPLLLTAAICVGVFSSAANACDKCDKFSLKSSDIKANSTIAEKHVFSGFGCTGKNVSPQLFWKNFPKETKGFALTVYDPDAPTGSGWWHWVVVNIPANQNKFAASFGVENKSVLKDGIQQVRNDFGVYNFGGPCPPKGDKPHRYIFTIHALKVEKLEIPQDATAALAGFMINANSLSKASFEAVYGR